MKWHLVVFCCCIIIESTKCHFTSVQLHNFILWTYAVVDIFLYLLNYSVTGRRDKEVKKGCLWTDLLPYKDRCFALQFMAKVNYFSTVWFISLSNLLNSWCLDINTSKDGEIMPYRVCNRPRLCAFIQLYSANALMRVHVCSLDV